MIPRIAYVDTKEKNHHDLWFMDGDQARHIPGTFAHEGLIPRARSQEFGDVWVQLPGLGPFSWLAVELKTWADFHASLRDDGAGRTDSRLRHQLAGLLSLQDRGFRVALMLVGTVSPAGGRVPAGQRARGLYLSTGGTRRVHRPNASWFELESARATVQSLGILTYQSPTSQEIPHALRLLAELVERQVVLEAPGLPRLTTLGPRHSFLVTQLTGILGVGVADASAIADEFGTFQAFYEADVAALVRVRGIGKLTAMKIHAAFHGYERDPAPAENQNPLVPRELLNA